MNNKLHWFQSWWGRWLLAWVDLFGVLLHITSLGLLVDYRLRLLLWTWGLLYYLNKPIPSHGPPSMQQIKDLRK